MKFPPHFNVVFITLKWSLSQWLFPRQDNKFVRPSQLALDSSVISFGELTIMSEQIVYVTDATFASEVLGASTPVLVDYWAEWCGPCKMIAPILEEVAESYKGVLKVAKLDIDSNTETPQKFGIRGIPTLTLFRDGVVIATKVGALSKSQLTAFIDSNL